MAGNADLDDKLPIVRSLYKEHAGKVRRYLGFRLGNQDDGADAAQDVFLKLWRRECGGDLRAEARNYMYAATQSAITDTERWRAVRGYGRSEERDPDTVPTGTAEPDDQLHWREALRHFVNSLSALPEVTGNVFLLSYFEGLTYPQIAKRLGISERTAERHIERAMTELRKRMEDYL
jgi:RNA polymerase sigma-70 factor (ECF subfamily)